MRITEILGPVLSVLSIQITLQVEVSTEFTTQHAIEQLSEQQTTIYIDVGNDDGEVDLYDEDGNPIDNSIDNPYIVDGVDGAGFVLTTPSYTQTGERVDVTNIDTGERCQHSAADCSLPIPVEGANLMFTLTAPTGGEAARPRPLTIKPASKPVPSSECTVAEPQQHGCGD